jgi:Skp family chaperone for outer membrane proteins
MNARIALEISIIAAVLSFAFVVGIRWSLRADETAPRERATEVAVLDVGKTLESYTGFITARQTLIDEVAAINKELEKQLAEIKADESRLQDLQQGSNEFVQLEGVIKQAKSRWQARVNVVKSETGQKEKKLHLGAYEALKDEVSQYAREHGIRLVLRYASAPVDQDGSPRDAIDYVNRDVIFQDSIDITPQVIERLNAEAPLKN